MTKIGLKLLQGVVVIVETFGIVSVECEKPSKVQAYQKFSEFFYVKSSVMIEIISQLIGRPRYHGYPFTVFFAKFYLGGGDHS